MLVLGEILLWLAFSYIFLSGVEWVVHRHVMHRRFARKLLRGWSRRQLDEVFFTHAHLHHGLYYQKFDHEDDPVGRDLNLKLDLHIGVIGLSPVWIGLCFFTLVGGLTLLCAIIAHHLTWGIIHSEMHKPSGSWLRKFPPYTFLARYHLAHHEHTQKNFNVVCPLFDWVMGTYHRASPTELLRMKDSGM